jgi:hypothetical protein
MAIKIDGVSEVKKETRIVWGQRPRYHGITVSPINISIQNEPCAVGYPAVTNVMKAASPEAFADAKASSIRLPIPRSIVSLSLYLMISFALDCTVAEIESCCDDDEESSEKRNNYIGTLAE